VLPLTSTLVDAPLLRLPVEPSAATGLRAPSQIMLDKTVTVSRERIGGVIGRVDADTMLAVERALALFLGIAR
jgi:mRNA interferase MazF